MTIDEKGIINNLTIPELEQIKKVSYKQGRADEKRENEQDAYHRGYIDGQVKCSFDNEMKIRADERAKVLDEFCNFVFDYVDHFFESAEEFKIYVTEQLKSQIDETLTDDFDKYVENQLV